MILRVFEFHQFLNAFHTFADYIVLCSYIDVNAPVINRKLYETLKRSEICTIGKNEFKGTVFSKTGTAPLHVLCDVSEFPNGFTDCLLDRNPRCLFVGHVFWSSPMELGIINSNAISITNNCYFARVIRHKQCIHCSYRVHAQNTLLVNFMIHL